MSAPTVGPCAPWITDDDLDAGTCCANADILGRAATIASTILYRLSGRQFPGVCERTLRPCGIGCSGRARWPAWRDNWWFAEQVALGGGWDAANLPRAALGACANRCHHPSIQLPGPIVAINEVVVNGEVLDTAAYRNDYRRLYRTDGYTWPCTQNLALESGAGGDTDTWQVTYLYGRGPGEDGLAYAREYACELAKAMCPEATGECRLPMGTRSIVRQGISIDMVTPLDFLDEGRTGLPGPDLWIRSVNPGRLSRRATVSRLDS